MIRANSATGSLRHIPNNGKLIFKSPESVFQLYPQNGLLHRDDTAASAHLHSAYSRHPINTNN